MWLGWLRSIDLGFDKCRETLGVILGAGTGVSWPRSAPTMPITAATIRRSVDMYAVHWFQRLLVVMRHGESTGVARSQQSKLWSKHVHILGSQVDHDRSPRLAPVLTDKTAQSMRFSGHGMAAGTRTGGALAAATSGVPAGASAAVER